MPKPIQTDPIQTIARLYPRLMRAMGHLRGAVDEAMDLTYNQYKMLLSLSGVESCTLNDLSNDLQVAPSSASQMVDRLVGMRLIKRTPGNDDRRQVALETTPDGEKLLEQVKGGILKRYQQLFMHLENSEQSDLAGAIHTLVHILEKAVHDENREMK